MVEKIDLLHAFATLDAPWAPKILGNINDFHIKIARFEGEFVWHHHEAEDELFLVHRGKLLMMFRDHDEILGPGDAIIVPRGLEHCPVALTEFCDVILLEPATTRRTGNLGHSVPSSEEPG